MRFPTLETMITYGIYTVKELERFSKGLVSKKKVVCLSECKRCDFVYSGKVCLNCPSWNIVQWKVACRKDPRWWV